MEDTCVRLRRPPKRAVTRPPEAAPRSWLHELLVAIDDELVPLDSVLDLVAARVGADECRAAAIAVLRVLFEADWLRMTSFERGLGHVLWTESPGETVERIQREWGSGDIGHVKMTPTGANAARAMAGASEAVRSFYDGRDRAASEPLSVEVEREVAAVGPASAIG